MRHNYTAEDIFQPEKELAYYKHDAITPLRIYEPRLPKSRLKSLKEVVQMDLEGNTIATYDNAREAAKALNGNYRTIQQACRGSIPHSYSYKWAYKI